VATFRRAMSPNGPFAAAGWEFRERKLGKSTKDYERTKWL